MDGYIITTAVVALLLNAGGAAAQQQTPDVPSDIRAGRAPVAYEDLVQRYGASDTSDLIEMVNSPADLEHWARAAGILGVVGDERAVGELIDLIESSSVGTDSVSQRLLYEARKEALRGLGFLVHRTGNQEALEYLIESLDDTIWRRRGVLNVEPEYALEYYDKRLSTYAVYGLALSGHPRAGDVLRSLQEAPTPNQERLRNGLDGILDTYLGEIYPLVSERGIAEMYSYYEQQQEATDTLPRF